MKSFLRIGGLIVSLAVSHSLFSQDMPEPGVLVTYPCSLNDGYTVQDVLALSQSGGDDVPGLVQSHLRRPLSAFRNFTDNWDFSFANYFQNMAGFGEWLAWVGVNGTGGLNEVATCGGPLVNMSYGANQDADPYVGNGTLMDTQTCSLAAGQTYQDAYEMLVEVANHSKTFGSNIPLSMTVRTHGLLRNSNSNESGSQFSVTRVGTTAQDMTTRLDLNRVGELQRSFQAKNLQNPNASCQNRVLWATTPFYRSN